MSAILRWKLLYQRKGIFQSLSVMCFQSHCPWAALAGSLAASLSHFSPSVQGRWLLLSALFLQIVRIKPQQLHTSAFSTTRKTPETVQISRNMRSGWCFAGGGLQFIPFCINFSVFSWKFSPPSLWFGRSGNVSIIVPINSRAFVTYSTQDVPSCLAIGGMKCEEQSGTVKICLPLVFLG